MGGGWFNLVARLRLFQPGLARVGAGAELGNIKDIWESRKQAGAEPCQAQLKLGLGLILL